MAEIGLTPRAKTALELAQKEADRLGHTAVGPEHLALGLLREGTGLAAGVLVQLGVNLVELRAAIETAVAPGEPALFDGSPKDRFATFTAEARQALTAAMGEAQRLRHNWVGQEHILLALLRQGGVVAQVLSQFKVSFEKAEAQVLFDLGAPSQAAREEVKRYNLALPESLFREVAQLADREHTTVLEVLRRSVKLGLLVADAQQSGAKLILREGTSEREIVIL